MSFLVLEIIGIFIFGDKSLRLSLISDKSRRALRR